MHRGKSISGFLAEDLPQRSSSPTSPLKSPISPKASMEKEETRPKSSSLRIFGNSSKS